MKVCFLGVDGSGKTTLALFSKDYLGDTVYLHAEQLRTFPIMVWKKSRAKNVICDGYLFDYFVTVFSKVLYRRCKLSRIIVKLLSFFDRFDLVFYLECPWEVTKNRTSDINFEDYEKRVWLYNVVNEVIMPVMVDTDEDINQTKLVISIYLDGEDKR